MQNLAGSADTDRVMVEELKIARIPHYTGIVKKYGEVESTTVGLLGLEPFDSAALDFMQRYQLPTDSLSSMASFVFTRAWYYYIVSGFVPENVAWDIYNHPDNFDSYGKQGGIIRVSGHCGCVKPEKPWLTRHKIAGHYCVDSYHIDTQLGLNTFVDVVTKQGLV